MVEEHYSFSDSTLYKESLGHLHHSSSITTPETKTLTTFLLSSFHHSRFLIISLLRFDQVALRVHLLFADFQVKECPQ
uniref:Uncharacterized protein n=1 Tax=Vitis vinifera TaxID=29760 RepID=F6HSM9_VITVI